MSEEVFDEPDIWEGHDGIRGLMNHYANAPGFPGRQHHVTQIKYRPATRRLGEDEAASPSSPNARASRPMMLRFAGWYDDHAVKGADGKWRFRRRMVRLWDGEVLENFPGQGRVGAAEAATRR